MNFSPAANTEALPLDTLQAQYDEQGYCIADDLFSPAEVREIATFFDDYKRLGSAVFDGGTKYEEIDATQRQVRAMHPHRYSAKAVEWFTNPRVAEVLERLLRAPALGVQTMFYYKPPGAKGQGMHQDNFYLLARPATCIAAWTAIDDADEENGCLYVVPGSHKADVLCPESKTERWLGYGDSHISRFPRDAKPVALRVRSGQTIFFGGNLIHGSGPNRTSDRSRGTFIGHYVNETTTQLSKYFHPVLNMDGETVSHVEKLSSGGPCGDDWMGAMH